jgi:fermentation-respiration switch protein FrsA (DUF1100 family)
MPLQISSPSAFGIWLRRILLSILATAVVMYGGAVIWMMTQETRLVFQAGRPLGESRPTFPYEHVDIPRVDGARQFAWVVKQPERHAPWVLFLHGNAATIASRVNIAHYARLRELGANVLAPEYRGFAGLDGVPSEHSLIADARAAYDYMRTALGTPAERIIVYGWSLGSAVAVALAADVPSAAVILEGAPASLVAIGERQYPWMPIRLVMRNPFESIRRIDRVRAPLLFLHSPEDEIIPIDEGRKLYDAARAPKTFVEVRGGHVYASEVDAAVFYGAIERFLSSHDLLPSQARLRPRSRIGALRWGRPVLAAAAR